MEALSPLWDNHTRTTNFLIDAEIPFAQQLVLGVRESVFAEIVVEGASWLSHLSEQPDVRRKSSMATGMLDM